MIYPTKTQIEIFKRTPGAISVHEMVAIANTASWAPNGPILELGSHRGKSSVATVSGFTGSKEMHLVDPLYDMGNVEAWKHSCQRHPDNAWQGARDRGFLTSVIRPISEASNGLASVSLHGDYSTHAIPALHSLLGDFAYVMIDTDQHQYELVSEELSLLRKRMMIGGIIGFHDFMSQFLGVERAYREMLSGGMYSEVPIDWEAIKHWVSENGGESGNESWHHTENPTPCFYGAIRRIK